jgi:prepilin-type N-terminal cleavage/methylation domain-containing protein
MIKKNKNSFTLLELITVVVIVGILSMIAVSYFFKVAERSRAAEGLSILSGLRQSQIRHAFQYAETTDILDDTDTSWGQPRYFQTPLVFRVSDPRSNPDQEIARISRDPAAEYFYSGEGAYTLHIDLEGDIWCTPSGHSACNVLGYPAVNP